MRSAIHNAMAQLVTRLDDETVVNLDRLVAAGVFESRSDAVRQGLSLLLDRHRRRTTGQAIVEGYRLHPQEEGLDGRWPDTATVQMISDEPW